MYKKTLNSKSFHFSGFKLFWTLGNNQPVIDVTSKRNVKNKLLSKTAYDAVTLYANILNNKLKNVIKG